MFLSNFLKNKSSYQYKAPYGSPFSSIKISYEEYNSKKSEKRWDHWYELNRKATQYEKNGHIDEAIATYLILINECTDMSGAYERYAILQKKKNNIGLALQALEKGIWVFENLVYKERTDRIHKLNLLKERYKKYSLMKKIT